MITGQGIRPPAIAGSFYPSGADELAQMVDGFLANAEIQTGAPKALVCPHAGYVYSGQAAGHVFKQIEPLRDRISRVIILGPNHRVPLNRIAVPASRAFATPLGEVPTDRGAVASLMNLPVCEHNDEAHKLEHSIEIMLPFLQRILSDFSIVPLVVGQVSTEDAAGVIGKLWGGPETLIIVSTDLSHFSADDQARKMDAGTAMAIEQFDTGRIEDSQACGRHPLNGLLKMAPDKNMRITRLSLCNSGDMSGDRGKVVGYGGWALEYAASAAMPEDHRNKLHEIARQAIVTGAENGKLHPVDMDELPEALKTARASFTTLYVDGAFRGCRGVYLATRPVAADVAENAFKSAFDDLRVQSLSKSEAGRVEIGISILSHLRPIECNSEEELIAGLDPNRDGLVLGEGKNRALFLPKVWADLPDAHDFVRRLKVKAGLAHDHWSGNMLAYRFSAEYF